MTNRTDRRAERMLPFFNQDGYNLDGLRRKEMFLVENLEKMSTEMQNYTREELKKVQDVNVQAVVKRNLGQIVGEMVMMASVESRCVNDTDCMRFANILEEHVKKYGTITSPEFENHTIHFCVLKVGTGSHYFAVLVRKKYTYMIQNEKNTYDINELVKYLYSNNKQPFRIPLSKIKEFMKFVKTGKPVPKSLYTRLFHYTWEEGEHFSVNHFGILSSYDISLLFKKSMFDRLEKLLEREIIFTKKTPKVMNAVSDIIELE